jgi:hypothetical protein
LIQRSYSQHISFCRVNVDLTVNRVIFDLIQISSTNIIMRNVRVREASCRSLSIAMSARKRVRLLSIAEQTVEMHEHMMRIDHWHGSHQHRPNGPAPRSRFTPRAHDVIRPLAQSHQHRPNGRLHARGFTPRAESLPYCTKTLPYRS